MTQLALISDSLDKSLGCVTTPLTALGESDQLTHKQKLAAARTARWYSKLTADKKTRIVHRSSALRRKRIAALSEQQRERHRLLTNERVRTSRNADKEKDRVKQKSYYEKHKAKRRVSRHAYYEANKDRIRENRRSNAAKTKIARRPYFRNYMARRLKTDALFRLKTLLRCRLRDAVTRPSKTKPFRACALVGCSLSVLRSFLEAGFKKGMTWENHGRVWHIDHIIPINKFDLSKASEVKLCFHFSNLQPLLVADNLTKGDKITAPQQSLPLVYA